MTVTHPRTTVLDARYGRTPERRRRQWISGVTAAVVVAVLVVAWCIWTGVGGSASTLQVSTTGYELGSTSAQVAWEVDGRPDSRLLCAIEAQTSDGTIVGLKEVLLPTTGSATRKGVTVVRIIRAADNALIDSCRDA